MEKSSSVTKSLRPKDGFELRPNPLSRNLLPSPLSRLNLPQMVLPPPLHSTVRQKRQRQRKRGRRGRAQEGGMYECTLNTQAHTQLNTRARTQTNTRSHKQTSTHTHTQPNIRARTQTNTRTQRLQAHHCSISQYSSMGSLSGFGRRRAGPDEMGNSWSKHVAGRRLGSSFSHRSPVNGGKQIQVASKSGSALTTNPL